MAAVTEEDLEKRREKVEKLREQVAAAQTAAAPKIEEQSRAIEAAQLDAEAARLEAQLAAAKEAAKASNVKSGSEGPLAAVTAELEAAQAGQTVPGVTVDTNDPKVSEAAPKVPADDAEGDTAKKEGGNS